MNATELASAAAVAITVFGTAPYAVQMLRGRVRPHAFTWLVWTLTTTIAFVGQLVGKGGIGAAAAAASALVGAAISGYAFWRGERSYTRLDWLCLTGAGLALLAWVLSEAHSPPSSWSLSWMRSAPYRRSERLSRSRMKRESRRSSWRT